MKSAQHDLKGNSALASLVGSIPSLDVPLAATIDFRGFRLLAVSLVPVVAPAYHTDQRGRRHLTSPGSLTYVVMLAVWLRTLLPNSLHVAERTPGMARVTSDITCLRVPRRASTALPSCVALVVPSTWRSTRCAYRQGQSRRSVLSLGHWWGLWTSKDTR